MENIQDFIDWLPKVGFNSFFFQFEEPYPFLKQWYEHKFNPNTDIEEFNNTLAKEMSIHLDEEIKKRGIIHYRVGHG